MINLVKRNGISNCVAILAEICRETASHCHRQEELEWMGWSHRLQFAWVEQDNGRTALDSEEDASSPEDHRGHGE